MPSRKRHRRSTGPATAASTEPPAKSIGGVDEDVLRRFNEGLRLTEQRKREATARKREAEAHATQTESAQRRLEQAIAAVKRARQTGNGGAEAEAEWKAAKAEVLFLETGERPAWAPAEATEPESESADEPIERPADEPAEESDPVAE